MLFYFIAGMNVEEAKQSFLNLIQCWPLHKATLFDVNVSIWIYWNVSSISRANFQQSFTSNWPKNLWLAVDQRGVHLLEARSRNVLTTYEYESLIDYTPSLNHMLIITGSDKKQSKIIVNTNQVNDLFSKFLILGFYSDLNSELSWTLFQAFQMSNLIREYMAMIAECQEKSQVVITNGGGDVTMVLNGAEWPTNTNQRVQLTFLWDLESMVWSLHDTHQEYLTATKVT